MIKKSIKTYDEALHQAARAFTNTREKADADYNKAVYKATEICHSHIEKARNVRNEGIEQSRQFLTD